MQSIDGGNGASTVRTINGQAIWNEQGLGDTLSKVGWDACAVFLEGAGSFLLVLELLCVCKQTEDRWQ